MWHRLLKESTFKLPRRRSFSLQQLKAQASNVAISNWTDEKTFLLKLSGTNVDRLFGYNRTGMTLEQFTEPEYYDDIYFFYFAQIFQPCAGFTRTKLRNMKGLVFEVEALSFPLCDEEGEVRHLISFVEVISDRANQWHSNSFGKITEHDTTESKFLDLGWGTPNMTVKDDGNIQWNIGAHSL